ncbi:Oidioi.mRNA.OKI2018_I69.chr2.g4895.t1.cds [Oikopleura dioica]|uniref:Oidioi.mRNA.OKI2018_I69.chr2.g4895.t1.cds n=1 Tax=Oikopleura dioica TaxID=34765 RepID=A0ABN7T0B7_OIKDI|nr:Oidioi.mRNA.OKI2018_I69.chr2.g4895.t1.cds [Oikopleura dioica]
MLDPIKCESQRCQRIPMLVDKVKLEYAIGGEFVDIKEEYVDFGACAGHCKAPDRYLDFQTVSSGYKKACVPSRKKTIRVRSFITDKIISLKLLTRGCSCENVHFC